MFRRGKAGVGRLPLCVLVAFWGLLLVLATWTEHWFGDFTDPARWWSDRGESVWLTLCNLAFWAVVVTGIASRARVYKRVMREETPQPEH